MVNVNIVPDEEVKRRDEALLEDFVKGYRDGCTIKEICKRNDVSQVVWRRLKPEVIQRVGFERGHVKKWVYFIDEHPEVIEDYKNVDLSTNDILEKYGLSKNQWACLMAAIRKQIGVSRRECRNIKNYYKNKQGYFIIQKNNVHYGRTKDEDEAKRIVEWLKEHDWDKQALLEHLENNGEEDL